MVLQAVFRLFTNHELNTAGIALTGVYIKLNAKLDYFLTPAQNTASLTARTMQ
jgi:hypothetical protein